MNREASPSGRPFAPWWLGGLLALTAVVAIVAALRSLPTSTVILVRHAEKQSGPGDDPPLTPEGAARAERLAVMLGDKGGAPIGRVFASEVRRTQDTAGPLARKLGLPVTVVPARDLDGLLSQLTASPPQGASVVVGHSNTVPRLAARLARVRDFPPLEDDDFGTIFVVHVSPLGPPSVLRLRY